MQTIPLTDSDLLRLDGILNKVREGRTVLLPGQREKLAVAYQLAIMKGVVIPPLLQKVAKALSFDKGIF